MEEGGNGHITLIDDCINDICYVRIHELHNKRCILSDWINNHLPTVSLSHAVLRLEKSIEDNQKRLLNIGLMHDPNNKDAKVMSVIKNAFKSRDSTTVELALTAAKLLDWHEFNEDFHHLASSSAFEGVRHLASKLVAQGHHS